LACSSSAAWARSKEALLWTWKPEETGGNMAVDGQYMDNTWADRKYPEVADIWGM